MSDPWKNGDHAKCVNVGDIRLPLRSIVHQGGRYLRLGTIYTVTGLEMSRFGELCLEVGAEHGPKMARRFVKLLPGEESAEQSADKRQKVAA